jgi:hypothetical protein
MKAGTYHLGRDEPKINKGKLNFGPLIIISFLILKLRYLGSRYPW